MYRVELNHHIASDQYPRHLGDPLYTVKSAKHYCKRVNLKPGEYLTIVDYDNELEVRRIPFALHG